MRLSGLFWCACASPRPYRYRSHARMQVQGHAASSSNAVKNRGRSLRHFAGGPSPSLVVTQFENRMIFRPFPSPSFFHPLDGGGPNATGLDRPTQRSPNVTEAGLSRWRLGRGCRTANSVHDPHPHPARPAIFAVKKSCRCRPPPSCRRRASDSSRGREKGRAKSQTETPPPR